MNFNGKLIYRPRLARVTYDIFLLALRPSLRIQPVNCYLIKGDNGFTIIDTGFNDEITKKAWDDLISSGLIIEKVVLTHTHIDHIGLASWFQEKYHVPVYISDIQYEEMKKVYSTTRPRWINNLLKQHGYGGTDILNVLERIFPPTPFQFKPDEVYENHQMIRLGNELYEAIWTPGHSEDHFSFYNPKSKVMIVGDHIFERSSPIIANWSPDDMNPLENYFQSLQAVKEYSPKLALPGHGPMIQNVSERINVMEYKQYRRLDQMLEVLSDKEKTLDQVSREIYGDFKTLMNAPLMATISRAAYLESIGKVSSEVKDGRIYYKRI